MTTTVVAETGHGRVRGTSIGAVCSFKAIPYARPPLGRLRFRPPLAAEPWTGEIDATRFGPMAPQRISPLDAWLGAGRAEQSEDCLTLNLWTPGLDGARRPVMVWIHGGGFVNGSGSTSWYDGTRLAASGDAVVVTFNYRLGPLGFLYLGEQAPYAASGNAGLLDQVAALEWVRDNIAGFGGDPGQVTVFGESAGAMSIGALLGAPCARGLFRRAILQSGACSHVTTRDSSARVATAVLSALQLDRRAPSTSHALAEVPVELLLDAARAGGTAHPDGLSFVPVVDEVTIPRPPLEAVAGGEAAALDLLVGTNLDEARLFTAMDAELAGMNQAELVRRADEVWGPGRGEPAVALYRQARPEASPSELWAAMATDKAFRIPAIRLCQAQSEAQSGSRPGGGTGPGTYAYLFTWPSPAFGGALGSCHGLEVPFVFDNVGRPGVKPFVGDGDGDAGPELARRMSSAWSAFARAGVPGATGLPEWPRYQIADRATMELGRHTQVMWDPSAPQRRLWEGVFEQPLTLYAGKA